MNNLTFKIAALYTILVMVLIYQIENYKSQIENLNKQIELLECYKENYLIMADSIQNIHKTCFRIGQK
jgi:prefoldin subunit 5